MQQAFKEWVIVVDALMRGEQIVIFRKGGLREGRGGFQIEHSRFWLFPTLFPAPSVLRLEAFAEVVAWRQVDQLESARRLEGQHIWRNEVIAERFDWGRSRQIHAMAVRVFRLPKPVELPMLQSYGGCKSWIELESAPDTVEARPVLNDAAFFAKLKEFQNALGPYRDGIKQIDSNPSINLSSMTD
jgi:hypothetical protein